MTNYDERKKIIQELQKIRKSVVITYFTMTDRPNVLILQVADDAIRPLHTLLEKIGHTEKIDLFIYTRGGAMMTGYTIVKLLREYADSYNVIVPFRCHSAGTQIALGSNGIVMGKLSQLSPVDPSTSNLFNPVLNPQGNPQDPRNRKPMSVEDVQAYLNLSKDRVGLVSEDDQLDVFKELTKYYEPLALGNVNRVYKETKSMAREVLSLHMDPKNDEDKINHIIKSLTEEYTHDFIVTRDVAERIGLKVIRPSKEEEDLIMKLYASYEDELKMNTPFDAESLLPVSSSVQPAPQPMPQIQGMPQFQAMPQMPHANPQKFKVKLGVIESMNDSYVWISDGSVIPTGQAMPLVNFKVGKWAKSDEVKGEQFV